MATKARQVMQSPDNSRGKKFDPKWRYTLVRPDQVAKFEAKGYKILEREVFGGNPPEAEKLVLMGKPG